MFVDEQKQFGLDHLCSETCCIKRPKLENVIPCDADVLRLCTAAAAATADGVDSSTVSTSMCSQSALLSVMSSSTTLSTSSRQRADVCAWSKFGDELTRLASTTTLHGVTASAAPSSILLSSTTPKNPAPPSPLLPLSRDWNPTHLLKGDIRNCISGVSGRGRMGKSGDDEKDVEGQS